MVCVKSLAPLNIFYHKVITSSPTPSPSPISSTIHISQFQAFPSYNMDLHIGGIHPILGDHVHFSRQGKLFCTHWSHEDEDVELSLSAKEIVAHFKDGHNLDGLRDEHVHEALREFLKLLVIVVDNKFMFCSVCGHLLHGASGLRGHFSECINASMRYKFFEGLVSSLFPQGQPSLLAIRTINLSFHHELEEAIANGTVNVCERLCCPSSECLSAFETKDLLARHLSRDHVGQGGLTMQQVADKGERRQVIHVNKSNFLRITQQEIIEPPQPITAGAPAVPGQGTVLLEQGGAQSGSQGTFGNPYKLLKRMKESSASQLKTFKRPMVEFKPNYGEPAVDLSSFVSQDLSARLPSEAIQKLASRYLHYLGRL